MWRHRGEVQQRRDRARRCRDAGQGAVLALAGAAVIVAAVLAAAAVATRLVDRSRAQSAADAVALAGAGAGAAAAQQIAAANGAHIDQFSSVDGGDGRTVTVVVSVHGERARAAASTEP